MWPFRNITAEERSSEDLNPESRVSDARIVMATAIVDVLTVADREFYDQLTDSELYGYSDALWNYHTDLRDEWSRREMVRKAPA